MKPLTIMQSTDNSIRLIQYGNQNLKLEKYDGKIWVALLAPFHNVGEAIQAFRETTKTTTQADQRDLHTNLRAIIEWDTEDDYEWCKKPEDWQEYAKQRVLQALLSCLTSEIHNQLHEYDAVEWEPAIDACLSVGVDANGLDVSAIDATEH